MPGFSRFIAQVANLLAAGVNLAELGLLRISGRDDGKHGLFHGLALVGVGFHFIIFFLRVIFPEFVGIFFEPVLGVDEVHARLQLIRRRHELFLHKCRNVMGGHADHVIRRT